MSIATGLCDIIIAAARHRDYNRVVDTFKKLFKKKAWAAKTGEISNETSRGHLNYLLSNCWNAEAFILILYDVLEFAKYNAYSNTLKLMGMLDVAKSMYIEMIITEKTNPRFLHLCTSPFITPEHKYIYFKPKKDPNAYFIMINYIDYNEATIKCYLPNIYFDPRVTYIIKSEALGFNYSLLNGVTHFNKSYWDQMFNSSYCSEIIGFVAFYTIARVLFYFSKALCLKHAITVRRDLYIFCREHIKNVKYELNIR